MIQIHPQSETVHKGHNPDIDSYSAFFDNKKLGKTRMDEILKAAGVTDCYVCGIATDVCVGEKKKFLKKVVVTDFQFLDKVKIELIVFTKNTYLYE